MFGAESGVLKNTKARIGTTHSKGAHKRQNDKFEETKKEPR